MSRYNKLKSHLTAEQAANQAAQILDIVGSIAATNKDTDTLIATAKLWMNMVEVTQHLMITPENGRVYTRIGFERNEEENGRTNAASTDED